MGKVIIFDLYDTVLKNISFDFEEGINYLYKNYFYKVCSLDELRAYSQKFIPLYEDRNISNKEISFINDEYPLLCEMFKITLNVSRENLDYIIMNQMQRVCVLEEVRETLQKLQDANVSMYILSNSIFLASSHIKLLTDFGISQYFKKLFCSADFGIRKPDKRFFDYAIDIVLKENKDITRDQIYYVGNDYKTDVKGGKDSGLKTIWYNVSGNNNTNGYKIWNVNNFFNIYNIVMSEKNSAY